jgi:hypothetical protein
MRRTSPDSRIVLARSNELHEQHPSSTGPSVVLPNLRSEEGAPCVAVDHHPPQAPTPHEAGDEVVACAWCEREMTATVSCTVVEWHLDGVAIGRSPNRGRWATDRCGDCGTPRHGYHHPGCCVERCPVCGRQAITCGCRFDEDGPPDEDEDEEDGW